MEDLKELVKSYKSKRFVQILEKNYMRNEYFSELTRAERVSEYSEVLERQNYSPHMVIRASFAWGDTKKGHKFWKSFADFLQLEEENIEFPEMYDIEKLFSLLIKYNILFSFLNNVEKNWEGLDVFLRKHSHLRNKSLGRTIGRAFVWSETTQGNKFWKRKSEELSDVEFLKDYY